MSTLQWIYVSVVTAVVGALSFLLFRKVRQLEDVYDDLLDTKAQLKVTLAKKALESTRQKYERSMIDYVKKLADYNSADSLVILDTSSVKSGGEGPKDDPTPRVPKDTTKLH